MYPRGGGGGGDYISKQCTKQRYFSLVPVCLLVGWFVRLFAFLFICLLAWFPLLLVTPTPPRWPLAS